MSIALTMLEKAVEPSTQQMQAFENRMPQDSIIKAYREGTNQIINEANYKAAKVSLRRPVDIAVMKAESFFINTVREINPTPNIVTTAKVPLTFSTIAFSLQTSAPLNVDNYFSEAQEFRQGLFNAIMSAMYWDPTKGLEPTLAAHLESIKWAAPPASKVNGVTVGTGAYEMDTRDFLLKAPVVMRELRLYPRFNDIGNIGMLARHREIGTYGQANQQNLAQYQSEMDYYPSSEIDVTVGKDETHFLVPKGSLGLINWTEWDARNNTVVHDGRFTTIVDPFLGFEWGVFITNGRADQSSVGGTGLERASNTRYDFAASFAPVSPYSSVSGVSPVVKFDLTQA